jgi:hypothetical protein
MSNQNVTLSRTIVEQMVAALASGEGHTPGCKTHAFSDACTCGYDNSVNAAIAAGRTALQQPPVEPCTHINVIVEYDYVQCRSCGCVRHDRAGKWWHQSLTHARQFSRGKQG